MTKEKLCEGCKDMKAIQDELDPKDGVIVQIHKRIDSKPSLKIIITMGCLLGIGISASYIYTTLAVRNVQAYSDAQNEQQDKRIDLLRQDIQVMNTQLYNLTEVIREDKKK